MPPELGIIRKRTLTRARGALRVLAAGAVERRPASRNLRDLRPNAFFLGRPRPVW
jgi:hypothetical protein